MLPLESLRNLLFMMWRRRPFLLAVVMITTLILLVLQYQSITTGDANHVQSKSYSAFSSIRAEAVVIRDHPSDLEYRFDGQGAMDAPQQQNNQPVDSVDQSRYKVSSSYRSTAPSKPEEQFRLVHFDLKGAPPKIQYILKILPLVKQAGANGILLEYEDMFPWSEKLAPVRSPLAYSTRDIMAILDKAASLQLQVIPLVQTFGHLEFVLKTPEFRHLREVDQYPAAICPKKNASFELVTTIIDQVMALHKDSARWLHIGADEVFHMGLCDLCHLSDREDIFLDHVSRVAKYVKSKYHVQPIVWDDMLRNIPQQKLKRLSGLVEPMVWVYVRDIYHFVSYQVWTSFSEAFDNIWAASAFKGAFGETLTVPNVKMHLENNEAWVSVMNDQRDSFRSFRGIVITGWQRYDHLATLCETFPAAFPSLIVNLLAVTNGRFDSKTLMKKFDQILGCASAHQPFDLEVDPYLWSAAGSCTFPGSDVFRLTQSVQKMVKQIDDYIYDVTIHKAWLTDYNVRHNITYLHRVDEGLNEYESNYYYLTSLVKEAEDALSQVFDKFTVAEWIEQNIYPSILKLEKLKEHAESLRKARTWPVRPLPINADLANRFLSPTFQQVP